MTALQTEKYGMMANALIIAMTLMAGMLMHSAMFRLLTLMMKIGTHFRTTASNQTMTNTLLPWRSGSAAAILPSQKRFGAGRVRHALRAGAWGFGMFMRQHAAGIMSPMSSHLGGFHSTEWSSL